MLKNQKPRNKILLLLLLGIIVLLCSIFVIFITLVPASTPPITDHQGHPVPGSIASLEKVKLGGQDQWILIRGYNTKKPVILFLHGGPGTSQMGLLREYSSELEKHFLVVTWDQRGAGKSYRAINPKSAMTINQFVSDTHELTQKLCQRFHQKKIFLLGHSWGSVLGVLTVQKFPESYLAYIGIGQVANMQENEKLSYDWTLAQTKKMNDLTAVKKLKEIGAPPYTGDWQRKVMVERELLGKYGGEVYGNSKGAFPLVIGSLMNASEYTFPDKVNFIRGILDSMHLLWPELLTINLIEQAPKLNVPVYLVLGKHDHEVPFVLAEQYFKVLEAPRKELIWFENSAHMPDFEENAKFNDLLINHILPETDIQ